MHLQRFTQSSRLPSPWLENAIFGFDRWLRQRQGVFEFTSNPSCIFRIQRAYADEHVILSDGTRLTPADPILELHLWNEHVPSIAAGGPTVGWARRISRAIDTSLRDLASYLEQHPDFDDIAVVRADMCLGTAEQSAQLTRLSARYGFEAAATGAVAASVLRSGALHRLGENVYIFLLVWAANPLAADAAVLRRDHKQAYLSRAALERRYSRGPRSSW